MQHNKIFIIGLTTLVLFASCGDSKKEGNAAINDKKTQLEKLKSEKEKKDQEILKLQEELSKLDTSSANPAKIKLVAFAPIVMQNFDHYIELQGKIDAENSSYIAPRGMGGQVKQVLVKQGQIVRKGQLLLRLDNAIQNQQLQATKQQAQNIKTQLALAKSLAERQQNLWNNGIGTEVQLLTAKTNVTSLENQLGTIAEQVKLAQEQLNTANVYSDVNGVADVVNIRVGEIFQGATAAGPQIKIVNKSSLKVIGNIPENYLGTVSKGTPVVVIMPDINKTYNTTVSFIGAAIDPLSRGFNVEAKLPSDPALNPNQLALIKVRDYAATNTIAIPLKTLQNDEKGKYVMVASNEKGKLYARKRVVTVGLINGDVIEVKSGLKAGEQLIVEGYTGLYEGQQLKTSAQ
ncbi:efflux RND transporter periplasmic adaptor subunit [Ferruginibacter yonginensis]|uniref:Efflux RND transporter periplasmic adaptor subunit n=1 Tax=Ferruginibacter yonginensis TaxID=1310416 RepID=A0ABV8QRL4_9BACT